MLTIRLRPAAIASSRLAILSAAIFVLVLLPGQAALASGDYATNTTGVDISYPLCNRQNPAGAITFGATSQFVVIGVNGGRAFSQNRCFAAEYQAAVEQGLGVSFYINLGSPRGQTAAYGRSGPQGTCTSSDALCFSYNFGWNAAQYAYSYVQQTSDSLDQALVPSPWWLDVEVANYWSSDTSLNDQVIQGAIDYFQNNVSGSAPGVYSIDSMWRSIAGASYQPGVPEWLAGAKSVVSASRLCLRASFTGGSITLVQYATQNTDVDYAC
jgi:hypothetical protein